MSLARDIGDVVPGTNLDIPALDGSSDDGPRLWAEKSVMNVFRIEVEKRRAVIERHSPNLLPLMRFQCPEFFETSPICKVWPKALVNNNPAQCCSRDGELPASNFWSLVIPAGRRFGRWMSQWSIDSGCHRLFSRPSQKARSRKAFTFSVPIDLIEHIRWYRHVDADAFYFDGRRSDQDCDAILVFGGRHYLFK
jgi:hypothetical protein